MAAATDELCRSCLDLRWHLDPAQGSLAGNTDCDHLLGRFDEESVGEHLAAFQSLATAVEDLEVADLQDEIDRTALLDDIRVTQLRFASERPHVRNPAFWLAHVFDALYSLLIRPDQDRGVLASSLQARLAAVPDFLAAAEETLEEPPSVFLDAAREMIPGGGELIAETVAAFAPHNPELEQAAAAATAALTSFGGALESDLAIHPDEMAFAAGEDEFEHRLHHEHALRETAPELWRYGLRLEEEVTAEVERLAREIDPGVPWRELVERLRDETPADDGVVDAYGASLDQAREFTVRHDLVTLPEGDLRVVETPDFMRPLVPFAAYQPPGPLALDRTGLFFVTTPRSEDPEARRAELRGHCLHELPTVALHEAYPGHHLQILTAQRQQSMVRRFLWTPVMVEGWALYCESLMAELGYYRSAEARLFQLVMLLWRAVRVVLDVGLHTRGMTPAEAVTYLTDRLPMEHASAVAEIRRYCANPTYQLCYAVGRRDLLSLRDDYLHRAGSPGTAGNVFSWRSFHDELLGYGGLPVALARWGMGL